ncbi:DUF4112 domain-containing protein [Nitrosomonas sp.]|uniref:DUF4112 domain-containing protein n=1 Tax=Nitrosomonas sp. TaxID=42353 RepID=UPI0020801725|nr:DUF4112 domain-containing protein [Nitrosomonas sp.]GJL76009.1 MAG: hypothetical protein NMNS02_21150 [Nitrosomonas sp.]
MHKTQIEQSKEKLNRLAWLLDSTFRIPGTQFRFGLDGLIGMIPGIGDAAGAIISSHILTQAAQMGAPKSLLVKMGFNIGLDAILGLIPVIGDISDFVWKANQRNVKLLNDYLEQPDQTVRHSRFFVGALGFLVIGVMILIGTLSFLLMRWLWFSVQGS